MDTPSNPAADQPFYPIPAHVEVVKPLPVLGEIPRVAAPPRRRAQRVNRRVLLAAVLFVATCLATFWAGAVQERVFYRPVIINNSEAIVIEFFVHWREGLQYMAAVMGILLAHEMGHFLQAVRYGVPATLPLFIPMPLTPLGTMGAVISMSGSQADRKELFDIGISGPLAGLLVAIPLTWIGIQRATPVPLNAAAGVHFQDPLLIKILMSYLRPNLQPGQELLMNPFLMAGWVGMLVTGLNMLPISQLDGGHVAYAILGRHADWLARAVLIAAIAFIVVERVYGWMLMLFLVGLIGIYHPPTANDQQELGITRRIVGLLSLSIPILCLAPNPISVGH